MIFIYYPYILKACYIYLLVPGVLWPVFRDFLHRQHVICEVLFLTCIPIWRHVIEISCLIAQSRLSNTMVNRCGWGGYVWSFLVLVGKHLFLTFKCDFLCRLFITVLYQVFSIFIVCWGYLFKFFAMDRCWIFFRFFPCI